MSIAELERLWQASPDGAPTLLPESAWERIATGEAVGAVMMREGPGRSLSLVVALPSILVHAIDRSVDPGIGDGPGGGIGITLSFGPDLDWTVELTAHDLRVATTAERLAEQGELPIAWIDVDEQVVVDRTRRRLDDARAVLRRLAETAGPDED